METHGTAIDSAYATDYPKLASVYDENGLIIEYTASGESVRNDYGVPGSPVWYEIENIFIDTIDVNNVSYTPKELAAKFGKELADIIYNYCYEDAFEKEWDL